MKVIIAYKDKLYLKILVFIMYFQNLLKLGKKILNLVLETGDSPALLKLDKLKSCLDSHLFGLKVYKNVFALHTFRIIVLQPIIVDTQYCSFGDKIWFNLNKDYTRLRWLEG